MKVSKVNYTRPNINNNLTGAKVNGAKPSFGSVGSAVTAGLVGLAGFIERNGFLGEFLTIDSCGMMLPRTVQGYGRNREELGHLNYKAGREELVRELLSGPAFFYVPMFVLATMGLLRGKSAKVQTKVLDNFKTVMKKTSVNLKNAAETKTNFVKSVVEDAFSGYTKDRHLVDELSELMTKNVTEKLSLKDKVSNLFANKANKKETASMMRSKAEKIITKLNKANEKFLDHADTIKVGGKEHGISSFFDDMANYLDDFTKKAAKTTHDAPTFIDKFHQKANNLRNLTNILAVSALSAFLIIIPKLYQTGDKFPGTEGLDKTAQTPENQKKEAV